VNGNVKLGRAAARSGEWAQHFSNPICYENSISRKRPRISELSLSFTETKLKFMLGLICLAAIGSGCLI